MDNRLYAFLGLLGVIAVVALAAGVGLAWVGYSSAGPFSVAAACVGVIGTLAAEERGHVRTSRQHSTGDDDDQTE